MNEQQRQKYKENPDAFKERNERYVSSHLEQVKEARKRYKKENRQKCTDYERTKRQTDPVYRFRSSFICLIRGYLRKKNYKGGKKTWEIVGCDFDAFLAHIQSQFEDGMTLENYGHGEGEWNIDHIIPICTAKTDEEISVVCCIDNIPSDTYEKDMGWRAFRIKGVLDFSLTGILYKIAEIMAKEKIGIFAVSTYNTDYVFVKKENIERAAESLSNNGYNVSYLYDK